MQHKEFLDVLKKDHNEVRHLLDELIDEREDGANREDLFEQLKMELQPHLKAEEKVFYPVLRSKEESKEDTLEAIQEHHVTELVFTELEKGKKSTDEWFAKLSVFKELVEHHIKEEESKIFKQARKNIDKELIGQIMEKFEEAKESIRRSLD